jgi:hypothetical protein
MSMNDTNVDVDVEGPTYQENIQERSQERTVSEGSVAGAEEGPVPANSLRAGLTLHPESIRFLEESADLRRFYQTMEEQTTNLHTLIHEYEKGEMHLNDTVALFEERLHEFQSLEFRTVVQEKRSVNKTILQHLEEEIEYIEKSLDKICSSQFQKNIEFNTEYKKGIMEDARSLLGFDLQMYNRMSIQIEKVSGQMSQEIQAEVRWMMEMIHDLEVLEKKISFLGCIEKMDLQDNEGYEQFRDLIDMYETQVKRTLKDRIIHKMKESAEKIHHHFSVMKYLHENLYQKLYSQYTCGICVQNDIEVFYQHCGHVICKGCAAKSRTPTVCPYCKREGPIKNLFLI